MALRWWCLLTTVSVLFHETAGHSFYGGLGGATKTKKAQPPCGLNLNDFTQSFKNIGGIEATTWFCADSPDVDALIMLNAASTVGENGMFGSVQWWIRHGYTLYIQEGPHPYSGGGGWGNVWISTSNDPRWQYPNIAYTSASKTARGMISNLTAVSQFVSFRLNTTGRELWVNMGKHCHVIMLRAHSSGQDPYWRIGVCHKNLTRVTTTTGSAVSKLIPSPSSGKATSAVVVNPGEDPSIDEWFKITTGVSGDTNNWLLMVEQALKTVRTDCVVCLGPRPLLMVAPAPVPVHCVIPLMNLTVPTDDCRMWDDVFPLTPSTKLKPVFHKIVAGHNHTCVNMTGEGQPLGNLTHANCTSLTETQKRNFRPKSRADIWWWCGGDAIYDRLPGNVTGLCALVTLLIPTSVYPMTTTQLFAALLPVAQLPFMSSLKLSKRSLLTSTHDPTYIDAIGVPRGVPDEFKLVNQVAAGFESVLCWWCTVNKNVDRINYIHYNVQKLGNLTHGGFAAVHEQLSATSLMAFQNRIAVDMLLAEKGGVCAIFGEQCCTFIPNNTAADGSLTKAIDGLRSLNLKMKEHSGIDNSLWNSFLSMFGPWKAMIISVTLTLVLVAAILTLCGCCCIPCFRSLTEKAIVRAVSPIHDQILLMQQQQRYQNFVLEDLEDDEMCTGVAYQAIRWSLGSQGPAENFALLEGFCSALGSTPEV